MAILTAISACAMTICENELGDYQMGFRTNRSTIDNIFIVRQIFEKCHEYNIELNNIFIITHVHLIRCTGRKY
jgi:hypothetical protein